jgi:ABC-2 type transport system permease protein/oleandomycin transport system permease protein
MVTTALDPGPITADRLLPSPVERFRMAFADARTLARRNLIIWYRVPAFIVFNLVQPMMFMLLFRYVFGGAIQAKVPGGYVNYLVPGVFVQTCAFTSFGTAMSLVQEINKGSIDRLRSMPIARSAVLFGRLGADMIRLAVVLGILLAMGFAVGFRFENGFVPGLLMYLMALAVGLVVCCVAAWTGLAIKDE